MRVILSGAGFRTSEPLRVYAEHRVMSWLGHLERGLDVVTVRLTKETDPEGWRVRCRLVARPVAGVSLVVEDLAVEETNADLYEAIDRAPERLARAFELATRKRRRPVQARV